MLRIINYQEKPGSKDPLPDGWELSRDLFAMSYLCRGANFTDIVQWSWKRNVIDNRIEFIRQKTKRKRSNKIISIKIEGDISYILSKYTRGSGYIFPVIVHPRSQSAKRHQIKNRLKDANDHLKLVAAKVGLDNPDTITFYVARHTYATVLKKSGVPITMISELLDHEDMKTTQVYLDSFDNSDKDDTYKFLV